MAPDEYMEKLEQLVNDEKRIVTYKILSQELKIHVNTARKFLVDFIKVQKNRSDYTVNYFLGGFVEKDGLKSVKFLVVLEDDVDEAKKSFSELTSFHVYSINKGSSKDECTLYNSDFSCLKDFKEHSKFAAIKHPSVTYEPRVVLTKGRSSSDQVNSLPKKKTISSGTSEKTTVTADKNGISSESVSLKKPTASDTKNKKPNTLESMFRKQESSSNSAKKEHSKPEGKGKEAAKKPPKGGIMSLFSKQAEKNSTKSISTPKIEEPVKVVEKKESPKEVPKEIKKQPEKRKTKKPAKQSSKSKDESDSDDECQKRPKKHRRICTFEDSSESEPEEERDKAQRIDFIPEDPLEVAATPMSDDDSDVIPPTPVQTKGKAKIWKTVEKTYQDEDGFFVTKKEKELVSASEDEEEPLKPISNKKPETPQKNTKNMSNGNRKQTSLMSFFKQK